MTRALGARRERARGRAADGALSAAEQQRADLSILWRVAPELWPEGRWDIRARVIAALALLVIAKIATVSTPLFFKGAVDSLTAISAPGSVGAPPVDAATVFWLAGPVALVLGYGLIRFASTAFQQLRDIVFARVGQRALRRIALRTFRHIHALSLRYHLERRTGALGRIIDRGVKAIEFVLRFLLFSIAPLALELGMVAVIFLVAFDGWYFLVVLLTITAYIVFTFTVTEWRLAIRRRMNEQDADAAQKAVDSLINYETVKYFTAEEREARRYETAMRGYESAVIDTQTSLAALNAGQGLIVTAGLTALMWMAANGVAAGELTVGDFVMVNAYMIQIMLPLGFLGTVYREIRQSLLDMTDMFRLIDQPAEVVDAPGAPALAAKTGRVRFDRVSFGYGPERQILHEVDFDLSGGGMLALVGPSGAGKSTIARLLYRFYDVTDGAIAIDGQDIRAVTQESLRALIGVVPQDTVLFNDTIGYNIAYAKEGASMAEVRAAAKAAQIDAFIDRLPDGYDTVVGERGLKLSGGEKQRVAIARALLKNPPILILDEATSALDSGTEQEIQAALKELSADRTVVAIAHRLSTITAADEILVLDGGRVAERGRHEALLARGGLYAEMWRRQAEQTETPTPA